MSTLLQVSELLYSAATVQETKTRYLNPAHIVSMEFGEPATFLDDDGQEASEPTTRIFMANGVILRTRGSLGSHAYRFEEATS